MDARVLDAELHRAEQLLRVWRGATLRFDAPEAVSVVTKPAGRRPRRARLGSMVGSWIILTFGLAVFVCGGGLLAQSALTGNQLLWNLGLPLALIGQAGLVVGLILQMDAIWQTSREANETLVELDRSISRLRTHPGRLTSHESHSDRP